MKANGFSLTKISSLGEECDNHGLSCILHRVTDRKITGVGEMDVRRMKDISAEQSNKHMQFSEAPDIFPWFWHI